LKARWALLLILISTICYNLPFLYFGMKGYDVANVPKKFYSFYCLFISFHLFLISLYALYLFIIVENIKTKLLLLWLVVAEIITLLDHLMRKYILIESFNGIILNIIVFFFCCLFVIYRALKKNKSEIFRYNRTYIVSFLPKDFNGLINYLFTCSGHKAIYQDGFLYGFSKRTGAFVQKIATSKKLTEGNFREIQRARNIDSLIGKRYNIIYFNCNHIEQYAK
jgi:hypothetical protein